MSINRSIADLLRSHATIPTTAAADPAIEFNGIENGNFVVDQMSHKTRTGVGSSTGYLQDRWFQGMSQSPTARFTYSVESSGGVDSRSKWAKLECTTAQTSITSTQQILLRHYIIGNTLAGAGFLNSSGRFKGGILSFDIIIGSTATFPLKMGVSLCTNHQTSREVANDVQVDANATWQRVSWTIPSDSVATFLPGTDATMQFNWALVMGSGSQVPADTWQNTAYTAYSTSASHNFAAAVGTYVGITNVKFQPGTVESDFIPRTYAEELAACKYHAEKLTYQTAGSQVVAFGQGSGSNAAQTSVTYAEKRVAPTITGSAAGTFQLSAYGNGGNQDATSVSWNEPGLTNVRFSASYGGSAFTQDEAIRINRDGSDAAYIFIDAGI